MPIMATRSISRSDVGSAAGWARRGAELLGVALVFAKPLGWPWLPVLVLPFALLASTAYLATWPLPESWPYWVGLGGFVGDFLLPRLERPIGPDRYPPIMALASLVLLIL